MTHKLGACSEPSTMIVKVQVSLFTSHTTQRVLTYNEDRSVLLETDINPSIKAKMKGRPKAYFHAHACANKKLSLDAEAESQEW